MNIVTPDGKRVAVNRVTFVTQPNGTAWPVLNLADGRRVTSFEKSNWVELSPKKDTTHVS